jgi:hypothetical protein
VSDEFTVPLCRGHHRQLHQAGDLPLNFHPAAIRASANVTPFGAVSVPA